MARKKGFQIGLNFTWPPFKEIVIEDARFIPLQSDEINDDVQRELLGIMGRPSVNEDLSTVPAIAIFGYLTSLNGLASWFRPWLRAFSPSGITFRTRFPEVGFRFVPIHEIGHFYGLNHDGHDNASMIMWSPKAEDKKIGDALPEFLFLSGEANFTEEDAVETWKYITTTDRARDTILP